MIRAMIKALWKAFREPPPEYPERDSNGSIPPPQFEGRMELEVSERWVGREEYEADLRREADEKRLRELRRRNNPTCSPFGHGTGRCSYCQSANISEDSRHFICYSCGLAGPADIS